ncbi:serine protease persephone-like isoform X2 [Contarinia nasturtii]|uniref:serine protease persephone-like isoform X2 n=1 Tax=Contarinia nasturtii TaxID=265458 RepID=UPI0012D4266A|nr:serine protease persephone-like isoform X2 [Contarinia nasturtii]
MLEVFACVKYYLRYLQAIKDKLEHGANINAVDEETKRTPLHQAINGGNIEAIKYLIDNGADVYAEDNLLQSMLHIAAQKGNIDVIRYLIDNGANVTAEDKDLRTPLHYAASGGHEKVILNLLVNGANVNAEDMEKKTPLHYAIQKGHTDAVNLLMRAAILRVSASKLACTKYSRRRVTASFNVRIVSGDVVERGEFPWMAALYYVNPNNTTTNDFRCGGTIISERYIMTAGHCVPTSRKPVQVRVGKITLNDTTDGLMGKYYSIEKIIRHPEYDAATLKNDIALIQIRGSFEFSDDVAPACLPTNTQDFSYDLIVTGWGTTDPMRANSLSNVLLKANLKTMVSKDCNSTMLEWNKMSNLTQLLNGINDGQYCAYDPKGKRDACRGDSGGPLQFIRERKSSTATVVGIVSFGHSCGLELPSIYTRVGYFRKWIESIVWP